MLINMPPQLTIIIPFLNEKEEVSNTVRSIREHSNSDEVVILLINDASDDDYDYRQVAETYQTEYILNPVRLGVAASRDMGVAQAHTPYVMLLDAHMRFYDDNWLGRIIDELEKDEKALLCCQTKGLQIVDGKPVEISGRPLSYGACVNFYTGRLLFECEWIFYENEEKRALHTVLIPCVLGATYCCSKKYWQYLRGVEGLTCYGNDEPYISMKVYMEGGSCKLLKDVTVGHIYRSVPPYRVEDFTRIYNRLLLSELLLPDDYKARLFSQTISYYYCYNYQDALFLLYKNRREINALKQYYKGIFKHDFTYYESINRRGHNFINIVENREVLLKEIAHHVILNTNLTSGIGLLNGKMGIVLFLFHYGRHTENDVYIQLAEKILDDVIDNININTPLSFHEGLMGIGWAVEYLHQKGLIDGDTNDILEAVDNKVMESFSPSVMEDLNLDKGLGGIVQYVLARLYTIEKEKKENSFASDFLCSLYEKVKRVLDNKTRNSDSLAVFIRFVTYFEELVPIQAPSIYDIVYLRFPLGDYQPEKYVSGLDGNSGAGLKLIFETLKSTLPFCNSKIEYI